MFKIRGTVDSIALFQCHAIQVSLLDFAHPSAPRREKISICDRLEKGKLSLQNVEFMYIYIYIFSCDKQRSHFYKATHRRPKLSVCVLKEIP